MQAEAIKKRNNASAPGEYPVRPIRMPTKADAHKKMAKKELSIKKGI